MISQLRALWGNVRQSATKPLVARWGSGALIINYSASYSAPSPHEGTWCAWRVSRGWLWLPSYPWNFWSCERDILCLHALVTNIYPQKTSTEAAQVFLCLAGFSLSDLLWAVGVTWPELQWRSSQQHGPVEEDAWAAPRNLFLPVGLEDHCRSFPTEMFYCLAIRAWNTQIRNWNVIRFCLIRIKYCLIVPHNNSG